MKDDILTPKKEDEWCKDQCQIITEIDIASRTLWSIFYSQLNKVFKLLMPNAIAAIMLNMLSCEDETCKTMSVVLILLEIRTTGKR